MANDPAADAAAAAEMDILDEDIAAVGDLPTGDDIDWQKEAEKYKGIADRRTTKLKKLKDGKKPAAPAETPAPAQAAADKGKLDYGQKAFLASSFDVKHPDDVAYIEKAMKETGGTLEEVMASTFVQGQLKEMQETRTTKEGTPPAQGRNGAASPTDVEYWLNKDELPPADQTELRRKVVNARIERKKGSGPFGGSKVVIK